MDSNSGQTIQIYLPTGEPRGIRIAEQTTRIVQAMLVPRSELKEAKERPELGQNGVYFLFGEDEEKAKPIVYIGQTEDASRRLDQHNKLKDFWQTAVLAVSKTGSFTQAHIRYLEWYCIVEAKSCGRFTLDNDQEPTKPSIPEPLESEILDSFGTIKTLLSTLGYPLFDPLIQKKPDSQQNLYYCTGPNANGVGEYGEDGFVVHAGSMVRKKRIGPTTERFNGICNQLVQDEVLREKNDDELEFIQNYQFNSPSASATLILGRSANGWTEWKRKDGKTLDQVERVHDEASNDEG
jgi:Domain of unknown function (DUF4357)